MALQDVAECDDLGNGLYRTKKPVNQLGMSDILTTIAENCTVARFNSNVYDIYKTQTLAGTGGLRNIKQKPFNVIGHKLVCLLSRQVDGNQPIPYVENPTFLNKEIQQSDVEAFYTKKQLDDGYNNSNAKLMTFNPNNICLLVKCYAVRADATDPVIYNKVIPDAELATAQIGRITIDVYYGANNSRDVIGYKDRYAQLAIIDSGTFMGLDNDGFNTIAAADKNGFTCTTTMLQGNTITFTIVYNDGGGGEGDIALDRLGAYKSLVMDYKDMQYLTVPEGAYHEGAKVTYVSIGAVRSIVSKLGMPFTFNRDSAISGKVGEDPNISIASRNETGTVTNDIYSGADVATHNPFVGITDTSEVPNDYKPYDPTDTQPPYDPNSGEYNALITTDGLGMGLSTGFSSWYNMDYNMVAQMARDLWNANDSTFEKIINGLKMLDNPMDFITSLKLYPFDLSKIHITTSPSVPIYAGRNQLETAIGLPLNSLVGYIDFGELFVYDYFSNYLSVEPYSTCEIYLPFIGVQTISLKDCIRSWLNLEYYIDLTTGTVTALLLATKKEGETVVSQNQILTASGIISVDIPVTGNNNSRTAQAITSAFVGGAENTISTTAQSLGSSGAVGAVGALVSGGINTAYNTYVSSAVHPTVIGTATSLSWSCLPKTPYLIFSKPNPLETHGFGDAQGYMFNDSTKISNCSGFVKCSNVHFDNSTNETIITNEELKMLKELMEGGFYV